MTDFVFVVTGLLTVGLAVYSALTRNVVYSAFALLATLAGVAGLYLFLSADFLAAVQVLVYVGGVMVLFLFALMVTAGIEVPRISNPVRRALLTGLAIVPFLALSAFFISAFATPGGIGLSDRGGVYSAITSSVGRHLIERHMVSFEVLSVLLLVALLGAVAIVRRTIQETGNPDADSKTDSAKDALSDQQ